MVTLPPNKHSFPFWFEFCTKFCHSCPPFKVANDLLPFRDRQAPHLEWGVVEHRGHLVRCGGLQTVENNHTQPDQ